jgi:hypothetical protein
LTAALTAAAVTTARGIGLAAKARYRTEGPAGLCNYYNLSRAETHVQQQALAKESAEMFSAAAPIESAVSAADIARSEHNILQWMQYLPADCVKTMIRMGWDITT